MRQGGARGADDAGRLGNLAFHLAVIERWQQLALREIAGAPEHDIVKRFDGNDLAAHGIISILFRSGPHII
ncbi:hypothetical protein D3C87_2101390 [compost metagenome]